MGNYAKYLDPNVVKKLGLDYFSELGFDPWNKNLYQIYPGPWPATRLDNASNKLGLVPFRIFDVSQGAGTGIPGGFSGGKEDNLTISVIDPDTGQNELHGYAASRTKKVFIWSYGSNLVSGQALYRQRTYFGVLPRDKYGPQDDPIFMAGGDDINNWDSGASWGRFYN